MRVSRLHIAHTLVAGAELSLPAESAHYLGTVLRARQGDQVRVFNAVDGEFDAVVSRSKKGNVDLTLGACVRTSEHTSSLHLHLALGLSRGDRMDYAIQKATELGVTEITPLFTEHGEVRLKPDRLENKLRHFEKIAINAAEQCGRLDVPVINTPLSLEAFLAQETNAKRLLLEPGGEQRLTASQALTDIQLLIGPEGGFSEQEVAQARASNCEIMRLGPRVLRTETAPVAALAILQFLFGDLS
ncbi:MAG: 16S rRNA (uracil(1498)-N(3))-methyltransferase [Proteobacteria bacterium]|nr:16S rRNA (uracil(1498)-N(3))-methyltransferase [Pseudomonadota bacterium]